jgi:murein DD-endopeptidase MepM/ murein hydrolase activator NlpD
MKKLLFISFFLATNCLLLATISYAQTAEELKSQIDSHSEQIKKLNEDIKKYQIQIDETGKQANTLTNTIKTLDINQQKVGTEIKKTETSISKTNLILQELSKEILTTEQKIDLGKQAIASSLRNVNETDDVSMVEIMLGSGSLNDTIETYQISSSFSQSVEKHKAELSNYKADVETKHSETEKQKEVLVGLKSDLKDQNTILANNKKEKNTLLAETKNKESEYKKILADKQAEEAKFEKELFELESKLKIKIDTNKLPKAGDSVLAFPLDKIRITQPFGSTVDSKRLYVSGTHNGVDFAASRGTPVKAVLSGTVQAAGNTDEQRGCYSYGKWVLIKHDNGLTSLYAHFDLIKVSAGQTVSTGDIIGYSGATGYATGPHLHLTLYASQGVRVERYTSSINCKNVDIPVAPSNAYLDPLNYLPARP